MKVSTLIGCKVYLRRLRDYAPTFEHRADFSARYFLSVSRGRRIKKVAKKPKFLSLLSDFCDRMNTFAKVLYFIIVNGMDDLSISQNHILAEQNYCRGEYKPAFMQIRIHDSYNGNIDELDVYTLGTLVHEYIHFLQNISTPWGLYDSMVRYNIMTETYAFVEDATSVITIPLKISYSQELSNKIAIVKCGTGYCPLADTQKIDFDINRSEQIHIHRKYEQIGNKKYPIITLDICYTDGSKQNIILGANIIKESMAALYQMLVDETATHNRYDLPYNLIKIIAEQHFPLIATDNVKLITICYMSLFSLSPAEVLVNELAYANDNPQLSAIQLFERFVNEAKINVKGKSMTVCDFFDTLIETFKQVFSKSVKVEIDYIGEVLERIRPANGFVPILTLITDYQPLSKERIKELINFLGMPYSYTDNGDFNPPLASSKHSDKISDDMLALIGHNALFTYLTGLNKCGYVCPLHTFCEKQNFDKDECYDEPWNGKICPMTIMGDIINIKDKTIKIQYQ